MRADTLPILPCACASLRRAARAVTRSYETALRDSGLRATQFTLLQALDLLGPSPQGALGQLLALDSTTLTRTLAPLQRAGWIRAGPGEDRRERRWFLTPAGRRVFARARPGWVRAQASLRGRLGGSRWERLAADLAVVSTRAMDVPDPRSLTKLGSAR